jgi:hypothetical protein
LVLAISIYFHLNTYHSPNVNINNSGEIGERLVKRLGVWKLQVPQRSKFRMRQIFGVFFDQDFIYS